MKILFLDHAPVMGGAEIVTMELAAMLDRARYNPLFVTSENAAMLAQLKLREIPAHVVYLERINQFHPRGVRNLARAVRAVARIARQENVDVIQSVTARMHIVAALAALVTRLPVVWTLHDITLPRRIVRAFGWAPRRVTAVSNFIADHYAGVLNGIQVVYPGVMPAPAMDASGVREKFRIALEAPLIVNVGRLIRGKGQDVFLRAVAQLNVAPRAHSILVGAAQDLQFTAELRDLRERLGTQVTLTGHRDDVSRFVAAADVCVYSAVEPEGLPRVILEAQAHGKPVIASALGGARELVRDGETGVLVPPRDADALARALMCLLRDRSEAKRMGEAGRARVEREFSVETQAARYQEIYASLARKSEI